MTAAMLETRTAGEESGGRPLRWLFVKERFSWPRAKGHDVHTYGMMRALAEQGHAVSLLTAAPPPEPAVEGVAYAARYCLSEGHPPVPPGGRHPLLFTRLQARFQSYWGVSTDAVRQVAAAAEDCGADAVVVSGMTAVPYLGAVAGRVRVWYAADELTWHHLSMVKPLRPGTWGEAKQAAVKNLYERAFRRTLDRVWVVTDADARAYRWLAGIDRLDVIPNGVDADHYRPLDVERVPNSCAFWGRLDFGPNVQALEWFCRRVWPRVRAEAPDARLRVFGFEPTAGVRALSGRDGVEVIADAPDLRAEVQRCQVAVLPFVSGGGIKNKMLEAAAMGMPILSTPRGCLGLRGEPPFAVHTRAGDWARVLLGLWGDAGRREALGAAARRWAAAHHTWDAAARQAADGVRRATSGGVVR